MTTQTTNGRRAARAALAAGAALALAGVTTTAGAQEPAQTDLRWRAWTGCWAPGSNSATPIAENAPTVCVVPTSEPAAVELVAVGEGRVVARERVVATGEQRAVERDGCTGWERATWSADGRRLFRHSEQTCANGVKRSAGGVFAIAPTGEWLDIRGIGAGASSGIIAVRYRPVAPPAGLPADLAAALPAAGLAAEERAAAAGPLAPENVIEASKQLDAAVVAALLVERGEPFQLDGKRLAALADAGVPGRVIDAMVAVSFPKVFAVNRATATGERREPGVSQGGQTVASSGRTIPVYVDPFGWSPYGYGYSPFGYRYGYRYGYSPFGWGGYGYGYYGNGPVIVIRDQAPAAQPHGRMVRGRGYQAPSDGGSAPRGSVSSGGGYSSGGSSSSGSSSSGSSSSGSSSSGGGGRTAHPRTP